MYEWILRIRAGHVRRTGDELALTRPTADVDAWLVRAVTAGAKIAQRCSDASASGAVDEPVRRVTDAEMIREIGLVRLQGACAISLRVLRTRAQYVVGIGDTFVFPPIDVLECT
jgi:hypothetical protein